MSVDYNPKQKRVAAKGTQKPTSKKAPMSGTTYRPTRNRNQGPKKELVSKGSDMSMMHRFMRVSRKMTGTQLNKTPARSNDKVGEVGSPAKSGLAHGDPYQQYMSSKSKPVRKVVAPQNQASKLTASKKKAGNNKPNKGMVARYK